LALERASIIISAEYRPHENALAIRIKDSGKSFKQGHMSKLESIEKVTDGEFCWLKSGANQLTTRTKAIQYMLF
jgi:hypothetical protein